MALLQVYVFLFVAWFWEIRPPAISEIKLFTMYDAPGFLKPVLGSVLEPITISLFSLPVAVQSFAGYVTIIPALLLAGLMLGSLALFMSSVIRQLENFAGVMNFVIFPMFFASSALYPLWRIREASPLLYEICRLNPFTYAVELIRFGFHGQVDRRLARRRRRLHRRISRGRHLCLQSLEGVDRPARRRGRRRMKLNLFVRGLQE